MGGSGNAFSVLLAPFLSQTSQFFRQKGMVSFNMYIIAES
jgi:hypothetical protein